MSLKFEVLKHLRKEAPDRWLLIEPHLLYLQLDGAKNYLLAMKSPQYSTGFHSETVNLISSNLERLVITKDELALIDLGPGYPDKALPIAKYCRQTNRKLFYVPVDINVSFLDLAKNEMIELADTVFPVHSRFEDCTDKIPASFKENALVMLGLTFMNFSPEEILPKLQKIGSGNSKILIAAEIIKNVNDISSLLRRYQTSEAQNVAFGPLRILGVSPNDVLYSVEYANRRIEMSFILQKPMPELGFEVHSKIATAISYRYTEKDFTDSISPFFKNYELFWNQTKTTVLGLLK